ncbi:hypothetical protein Ddc_11707 [Ditylenchus destructor]|nr:hypothetical protein Ddc_11707 [Ditylenchus destructor]
MIIHPIRYDRKRIKPLDEGNVSILLRARRKMIQTAANFVLLAKKQCEMSKPEHFPQHSQDSEHQPLAKVRKDVWAPLGYDTKIDVFKFLRPYDIRKFCVNVNKYWLEFCIENRNYLPTPGIAFRRTVEQRICSDEMQDFDQRIIDEWLEKREKNRERREVERRVRQQIRRRTRSFYLIFSAMLLVSWSCIAYLTVRINHQSKKHATDDLVALLFFLVIGFMMTHQLRPPGVGSHRYSNLAQLQQYKEIELSCMPQYQRRWFAWLCFRAVLGLTGLTFSYVFPHITPSTTILWFTLTVIHIPEWGLFFSVD